MCTGRGVLSSSSFLYFMQALVMDGKVCCMFGSRIYTGSMCGIKGESCVVTPDIMYFQQRGIA